MRIALVIGALEKGGAERQFVQLLSTLTHRGLAVRLFVFWPGGAYWQGFREAGLAVEPLFPARPSRLRFLLEVVPRLRRGLVRFQPDWVVSALYLANALAFLAVGRRGRRRLLWFLRASQLPRNWKRDLPKAFCRGFSDRIAGALSNSAAGLDSHRQEGFRFRWSAVVPNGIDTDEFFPAPEEGRDFRSRWAIPDDAPVIGMACRVDPVKGLSDALAVLQALRQEAFPGLRLLIAGGSGQRDRQALAKLARERGAEEALDLLGPVSDMRSFYNSLDALVLTSRAEGFPNAVAEAMACDIPVVATDVGDVREIVGELGHVAAPGDIQGLREGLEAVLGNPPGAGEAAASIRARYSKAAAADRFVAALEEAATQGKGP